MMMLVYDTRRYGTEPIPVSIQCVHVEFIGDFIKYVTSEGRRGQLDTRLVTNVSVYGV